MKCSPCVVALLVALTPFLIAAPGTDERAITANQKKLVEQILVSSNDHQRGRYVLALGRTPYGIERLLDLQTAHVDLRRAVVETLIKLKSRSTPVLLQILLRRSPQRSAPQFRSLASEVLGRTLPQSLLSALRMEVSRHGDETVRIDGLRLLGRSRSPETHAFLQNVATSDQTTSTAERVAAVIALLQSKKEIGRAVLRSLLNSSGLSEDTRSAFLPGLAESMTPPDVALFVGEYDKASSGSVDSTARALVELAKRRIQSLELERRLFHYIENAPSGDPKVWQEAVGVLSLLPNQTVTPALERSIHNSIAGGFRGNARVNAFRAAEALANLNNFGGTDVIVRFAKSTDPQYRQVAFWGLRAMTDHHELPQKEMATIRIRDLCLDTDEQVSADACLELLTLDRVSDQGLRVLLEATAGASAHRRNQDWLFAYEILRMMRFSGPSTSVRKIIGELKGTSGMLALWKDFLNRLDGSSDADSPILSAFASNDEALRKQSGAFISELLSNQVPSSDTITKIVANAAANDMLPKSQREQAVRLLAGAKSKEVIEVLFTILSTESPDLKNAVIEVLSEMRAPIAKESFKRLATSTNPEVRMLAAQRLGKEVSFERRECLELLRVLLQDEDPSISATAAEGIMLVTQDLPALETDEVLYRHLSTQLFISEEARRRTRLLIAKLPRERRPDNDRISVISLLAREQVDMELFGAVASPANRQLYLDVFVRRLLIEKTLDREESGSAEWLLSLAKELYESHKVFELLAHLARGTQATELRREGEWLAQLAAIKALTNAQVPEVAGMLTDILATASVYDGQALAGKPIGGAVENALYSLHLKSDPTEAFHVFLRHAMGLSLTEKAARLLQLYARSAPLGVEFPSRFTAEVREKLLTELEHPTTNNQRLAVLIYPKSDWNGAFAADSGMIGALIDNGYRVLYREAGDVAEAKRALSMSVNGVKADIVVLGGHGTAKSLNLGREELTPSKMGELFDESTLNGIKPGGLLVFLSCSVGAGKIDADNLVNAARRHIPPSLLPIGRVVGPTADATFASWVFDGAGTAVDVKYAGKAENYRASVIMHTQRESLSASAALRRSSNGFSVTSFASLH